MFTAEEDGDEAADELNSIKISRIRSPLGSTRGGGSLSPDHGFADNALDTPLAESIEVRSIWANRNDS